MFKIFITVLYIVITFQKQSLCLVELPEVEENDILKTEAVIRETANLLFAVLKIKEKYFKSPLEQYFIAHNYFITTTLQDYVNLKEIARLTRVNITDEITVLIDFWNEILNEDSNRQANEVFSDHGVIKTIDQLVNAIPHGTEEVSKDPTQFRAQILSQLQKPQAPDAEDDDLLDEEDYDLASNESVADSEVWVPDPGTRRIFDGTMTKIKHYPFLAVIQLFNQFYCAGSIIASDLVITAASCVQLAWNNRFFRENPAFLSVRIGSTFYTGGGEVVNVGEVYFYPTYNPKNLRDNICILRLVRNLKFGRKGIKRRVKRIQIDRNAHQVPVTTPGVLIIGWGARDGTNNIKGAWVNRLSYSVLDIYPQHDCRSVYSKEYVGQKNFCAGFISKGSGACNRDVGAPGVIGGLLVGIVSFGSAVCGAPDYPTVFTKIGFYADWIDEILDMDVPTRFTDTTITTPFTVTPAIYVATTSIVMKPIIVDIEDTAYVENLTTNVARNRNPYNDGSRPSSKSSEMSEETLNKTLNAPGRVTGMIADTTTNKQVKYGNQPEDIDALNSDFKPAKRKKKKKGKNNADILRSTTPQVVTDEEIENEFEKVWGNKESKEIINDQVLDDVNNDAMANYEEETTNKPAKKIVVEATVASRVLEDSLEPKKSKMNKKADKRKKRKKKKITAKTTTNKPSKKRKTTTEDTYFNEDRPRLKSITNALNSASKEKNEKATQGTTVKPVNPLDTLSQKEFYALLAEVLDKLERDSNDTTLL